MVLRIPETGLQLEGSAKTVEALPTQAFAITLSNSVIEDMIECAQNGEEIQLSLGNIPSFLYGSDVHRIPQKTDLSNLDLFLTDPSNATTAEKLPNPTASLFKRPDPNLLHKSVKAASSARTSDSDHKLPTGIDAAIERLKDSMAQAKSEKVENSTMIVNTPLGGSRRGGAKLSKSKLPPSSGGVLSTTIARSAPPSPALSSAGSPSMPPSLSASQQVAERAKELRSPVVHELAVREHSYVELENKWPGGREDKNFKTALDKVGEFDDSIQKYVMRKMYWKELDVYNYFDDDRGEDRQLAIDNAVKMYDRMRLGSGEPEWQKLLPMEERGKGKCLSKLQATIAKGPPRPPVSTPKITVQDPQDSSGTGSGKNGDDSGVDKKTKKKGAEPMARSSSQPLPPKKKISEREAQAKRLLSTSKKPATPKVSPTKSAAKSKDKGGRVLSKEFISDSDSSSSEERPLSTTVAKSKNMEKEREKAAEKSREKPKASRLLAPASKPKGKAISTKEIIKPQVTARPQVVARPHAQKRPRDEPDDSSSSSGTPLSKRFKPREIKAAPAPHSSMYKQHQASDSSSQNSSRSASFGGPTFANKSKNTSPAKSSPLASSPPTNASDLEHEREPDRSVTVAHSAGTVTVSVTKKRKAEREHEQDRLDRREHHKRQRLSQDLMEKARKFKAYYQRYELLHKEMVATENPPETKMNDLLEMRERLQSMKSEIYKAIPR